MTRDAESRLATRFCFSTVSFALVLAAHRGGQKEISGRIAVFESTTPLFMGSFLNFNACPSPPWHRVQDFGDSPHLYLVGDRPVIGIGQKSGRFFVLDAVNGTRLNSPLQVVPECHESNGLFATGAVVRDHFYAPGQNCKYPFGSILPTWTGQLTAIKSDGSGTFWQRVTLFENAVSGVPWPTEWFTIPLLV
jgi:hypothetical protein